MADLGEARGKIILDADMSGLDKAEVGLDQFGKKATVAGQKTTDIQPILKSTSTAALVAGGVIAAGFTVAVAAASDFEFQMSAIKAVSGATAEEMDLINDAALRIGKETSFSASEAAQAMEELVKAGVSVKDVLGGAADATVALAAAGGVDLPEAATIASNAMNQFNLTAADLPKVADLIAGAANASAIDVGQFGYSLSQAGAVANLVGLSFEDTATAIALMGNAGIVGSDAGTSLKSMLMRLNPSTKEASDLMTKLGIQTQNTQKQFDFLASAGFEPASQGFDDIRAAAEAYVVANKGVEAGSEASSAAITKLWNDADIMNNAFYDANGSMKSLSDVSQVLQDSLAGMSDQQKQAALTSLFGADAIRGAAILADGGAVAFDGMAESLNKISAADVAATRLDNMQGKMETLKGSAETLSIMIGQRLVPFLTSVVEVVTTAVDAFGGLDEGVQNAILVAVGLAGALLLVVGIGGKLALSMMAIREATLLATGAQAIFSAGQGASVAGMLAGKVAMVASAVATGIATAAQWALNAAMTANPVGIIIVAIAALVAGLIFFFTQTELGQAIWEGFMAFLVTAWEGIVMIAQTVWAAIVSYFTDAAARAQAIWQTVVDFFGMIVDFIIGYFTFLYNGIAAIWAAIMSVVQPVVDWFMTYVAPLIQAFADLIIALFTFMLSAIAYGWEMLLLGVSTVVDAIVDFVVSTFQAMAKFLIPIWTGIFNFIVSIFTAISNFIDTVVNAVVSFIRTVWGGIMGFVTPIFLAIYNFIVGIFNSVKSFISDAVRNVVNTITNNWNALVAVVTRIFNAVFNAVKGPIEDAINFLMGFKDRVMSIFAQAGQWLVNAGKSIIDGLIKGVQNALGGLTDILNGITDMIPKVKGPPAKDKKLLTPAGELIMQGLMAGIQSEVGNLKGMLGGLNVTIPSTLDGQLAAQVGGGQAGFTDARQFNYNNNVGSPGFDSQAEYAQALRRSKVVVPGWGA